MDHFIPLKHFLTKFASENIPGKLIILEDRPLDLKTITLRIRIPFNTGFLIIRDQVFTLREMYCDIKNTFFDSSAQLITNKLVQNPEDELLQMISIVQETGDVFSFVKKNKSTMIELVTKNPLKEFARLTSLNPKIEGKNNGVEITKDAIIIRSYQGEE